jgi:hypothetical protein
MAPIDEHGRPIVNFHLWLQEELGRFSPDETGSPEQSIWEILLDLLDDYSVAIPTSGLSQIRVALFASAPGVRVSLRAQDDEGKRRRQLALFRLEKIYDRINLPTLPTPSEILELANSYPLSACEKIAIARAHESRSSWLRREIELSGQVWHTELEPFEGLLEDAIAKRRPTREVARELSNALRRFGYFLDADGLVNAELGRLKRSAHWHSEAQRQGWEPDTLIFRQTSRTPCRECLRLHHLPNGKPRLYEAMDVFRPGTFRPNRGPRRSWVAKISRVHRNCVCAPWSKWYPSMAPLSEYSAGWFSEMWKAFRLPE